MLQCGMRYADSADKVDRLRIDPAGFLAESFPEMCEEDRGLALAALSAGKRVCVWAQIGYVFGLRPPYFSMDLTDDCCQPSGDYGHLLIIDLIEKASSCA